MVNTNRKAGENPSRFCAVAKIVVFDKRRIDVVGVVVLLGIAVGTALGLASGSARLVLLEGSVPTAIFGARRGLSGCVTWQRHRDAQTSKWAFTEHHVAAVCTRDASRDR